jgi:hypothetical protein
MKVERQRQSRLFPEEMKGAADAEPGFSGHVVRRDLARKVPIDIILHFLEADLLFLFLHHRDLGHEVLQDRFDLVEQFLEVRHFVELGEVGIIEPEELLGLNPRFDRRSGDHDDELDDPDFDHVKVHAAAKKDRAQELVEDLAGAAGDKIFPYTTATGITLLWIAALLTLYTGYDYLRAAIRHAMIEED